MSDKVEAHVLGHETETPNSESTEDLSRERANRNIGSARPFLSWFDPNDGPAERRLILKLDFFILSYAFIGFWVRNLDRDNRTQILYIDRGILANAYISGMREDLKLFGNELVRLNSLFTAGYCISMIPATLLVTRYPANYVVPTAMFLWGIFTLLLYRTPSYSYLAGFRFLVGLLEGPFFCSVHYVLGSWYRGDELVRRAGIFYVSSSVGTMTTGLLAGRIYQSLDGANGIAGWRWMYIIAAIMTFPVAVWGFFSFPGSPRHGKRWFFTEAEVELAKERMELEGRLHGKALDLKWATVKRFLGKWHFWILVPWNIMWLLGYQSLNQGAYTLWLKAQKQYSIVQVNNYTAISPSLGIIWILLFSWTVGRCGKNAVVPLIGSVAIVGVISRFAFVMFDHTSFGYKWFAVAVSYMEVSLSPVNYSLANIACAADSQERAFIISAMLATGTAFNTWVPLLAFPTVQAPRYFGGYVTEVVLQFAYAAWTVIVIWFVKRESRVKEAAST
ncbi:MFS general substrate transporter [Lophiostoma macrostomum CBS 122681]|uniref:MFS general substrate transporter n=1 Tax=Lophiostoma macrostomum CBS 122681 TaxID=1314788 RepID=A0A6A6SYF0_9PLEO|nr:MFS general substrate transporter [Lophiostoma macrostomum CBS 122681]